MFFFNIDIRKFYKQIIKYFGLEKALKKFDSLAKVNNKKN